MYNSFIVEIRDGGRSWHIVASSGMSYPRIKGKCDNSTHGLAEALNHLRRCSAQRFVSHTFLGLDPGAPPSDQNFSVVTKRGKVW